MIVSVILLLLIVVIGVLVYIYVQHRQYKNDDQKIDNNDIEETEEIVDEIELNSTSSNTNNSSDCVGNWVLESECDKTCGGGVRKWRYNITSPALDGGTPCAFSQDEIKQEDCNQHNCDDCVGNWVI